MTSWSLALVFATGLRTLVLPFENLSEDRSQQWKGSALEEAISSHFESAGIEVVDFGSRNRQLRERGFAPGEALTRASAIVVAKDLGAEQLVAGEFRPGADRLEVTARIIDLTRGITIGVVDDFGDPAKLSRIANQIAKNLFRLERDQAPPGFESEAERREKIRPEALEASALARMSFDRAEARQKLERAIAISPDYLEARLGLGVLLLDEGLPREATDVLAEARGKGPLYHRAYFDLGLAYLDAGEPRLAFEIFNNLAAQPPVTAPSQNNLGVALMRLDRYLEATDAFEEALKLGGEKKTFLFNLGWSKWRTGKGAPALELFQKLASQDPVDAEAHLMLSAAAASQARSDLAERSRATALVLAPYLAAVDPATVSNWERPMRSDEDGGDPSWASVSVEFEEDVFGLMELFDARELRSRGRAEEAIQILQRSLYRDPSDVQSRNELVEIYLDKGSLDEAASELSVLLWSAPSAEAHVQLARLYLRMEQPMKAFEQVEKALELDPGHLEARGLWSQIAPQ